MDTVHLDETLLEVIAHQGLPEENRAKVSEHLDSCENCRQILAVYLRAAHRGLLALYAYAVTDESFAVNLPRFNARTWSLPRALVVNHAANLTWFISTVAGGIGGRFIPEGALGIDYALIAMFICLLIYQIRKLIHLLTAVIAGLTAVGLALIIPGNTYIVIASIAAATVGVIIQRKVMRSNPNNG